ncbi:hypothetical protein SOVF_064140 [Spinacia oleracea]|uniref:Uncharacterized protein n=1 Tax=Spinacia oleracea TaxID=3562 RepID=A0A9R0JKS6_SPIOL|nr:uncharacterized protein LOC110777646 [Spinacia oleracea]KNA19160.1 hypothetical protein SOVF_064140 [Spinacia oleracea]
MNTIRGDESVVIRGKHRDEEGRVVVEKVEVHTHDKDTLKHLEKKLVDTGLHRLERHSADNRASVKKPPPKKGHGGKYTWEGPDLEVENEFEADLVLDKGDPNYVDQEEELDHEVKERIKGQLEVAKLPQARE